MVKGQQPGESDREYFKRLNEESARQQRAARDEGIQARMNDEAEEELQDMMSDDDLANFIKKDLGLDPAKVAQTFYGADVADVAQWDQRSAKVREQYLKQNKKRMFESKKARNKRVGKWMKNNKGAIKNTVNKHGKKGGCAVIAVALLGVGGGAVYGVLEAGHAIVSAMGY